MCQVITHAEQVTPDWLASRLTEKRCLGQGKVLSVQATKDAKHTATWFGGIVFLRVGYAGRVPASAPRRLFLKMSKPDLTAGELAYGKREVAFYTTIATAMDDPPLARCYDAAYSAETGRSHLLLDDLTTTHTQPEHPLPPSRADCERAIDALASVHGHWWDHPQLGTDLGELGHDAVSSEGFLRLPHPRDETHKMFAALADFLDDRLSSRRRRVYEEIFDSWPFARWAARLNTGRGITLTHGDAHAWNFMYPRHPARDQARVIDWHEWGAGLGTHDLAEMIVLWWYPERRARMEKGLVVRYHRRLIEHGVQGYDWTQCWDDYRLSALRILLYPVWMHAEGRPPSLWWPVLERGMAAFQDLACAELLA